MSDLKASFALRTKQSLDNPAEITQELLQIASNQNDEICAGKDVPDFARISLAYICLKIYCKIELNGGDELLLKNAMQVIKDAPYIKEEGTLQSETFYTRAKGRVSFVKCHF